MRVYGVLNRQPRRMALTATALFLVSLGLMLCWTRTSSAGPALLRPLERAMGEESWVLAVAKTVLEIAAWLGVAAFAMMVLRWIARPMLLWRSYPASGVVQAVGPAGASVNRVPVLRIDLRVQTAKGPVPATVRRLMDYGNLLQVGDTVSLDVSALDPTCVRLR